MLTLLLYVAVALVSAESCSDGAVRLVGGPNEFEGRVEVCLGGEWGRWCASSVSQIGTTEVNVFCNQLEEGTSPGVAVVTSLLYGSGNSSVSITDVSCQGDEQGITECAHRNAAAEEECGDVEMICRNSNCKDGKITNSNGLVDICTGGFRAGLCFDNFTPEAATVLCNQQGLSTANSAFSSEDKLRFYRVIEYDCTGSEEDLSECGFRMVTGRGCSSVRLTCSELSGTGAFSSDTSTTPQPQNLATTTSTASDDRPITSSPAPVTTILVVVCVVLALLTAIVVVCILLVLWRRRRSNKVALQEPGLTNINYEPSSSNHHRSQKVVQDERMVHNALYATGYHPYVASLPDVVGCGQNGHPQPPTTSGNEYAAIEVDRAPAGSPDPQTLLLSGATTSSESDNHTYSMPFKSSQQEASSVACTQDHAGTGNEGNDCHNYSQLNGSLLEPNSDCSQGNSEEGDGEYSQINDAHKYSKLSKAAHSNGYSQLDKRHMQVNTPTTDVAKVCGDPGEQEFPYSMPSSPVPSGCADQEGGRSSLSHSTTGEDYTGYSKLHVFQESQKMNKPTWQEGKQNERSRDQNANIQDELEDNLAYESWHVSTNNQDHVLSHDIAML